MQLSWNEKFFINFLFHFRNLHYILNILKDKMIVVANVFPKLQTVEILVISLSKKCRSEHALTVNMWKRPKYFPNLHESAFIMLFHHSQGS